MLPSRGFIYPEKAENIITTQHQNEAFFLIDSFDRFTLTSDGSYEGDAQNNNYIINHQKLNGFGQMTKCAITEYVFPFVTPNVNIRNQYFFIRGSDTNYYYVIVPEDFYTPAELEPVLEQLLNTTLYTNYPNNTAANYGAGTWVVDISATTNAFTISNAAVTFKISKPDDAPTSTIRNVIGISGIATPAFVNTVTGGIPPMAYTTYIDICSNALCKFQTVKDTLSQQNYTDIICRIYLQDGMNQPNTYFGARPCVIQRQITDAKYMKWNPEQMIGGIDISYRDDEGELLYIPVASSEVARNSPIFTLKLVQAD
jgi:hypothetical protein